MPEGTREVRLYLLLRPLRSQGPQIRRMLDPVPSPESSCSTTPGQPPKNRREQTPAQGPQRRGRRRRRSSDRKSDRGSSFERSTSKPESPAGKAGKKKRHRSNRVKVLLPPGNSQENSSTGLAGSGLFGSSGRSNFPRNQLFPEDQ